jgi:hypothetical protein
MHDEVKLCTFKPNILEYHKQKNEEKNSDIPGFDRHLLFMDLNNKKKKEREAIEAKVFHMEKQYNNSKHKTVTLPNPFNLS